jgi:hypothetical protein
LKSSSCDEDTYQTKQYVLTNGYFIFDKFITRKSCVLLFSLFDDFLLNSLHFNQFIIFNAFIEYFYIIVFKVVVVGECLLADNFLNDPNLTVDKTDCEGGQQNEVVLAGDQKDRDD